MTEKYDVFIKNGDVVIGQKLVFMESEVKSISKALGSDQSNNGSNYWSDAKVSF